MTWIIDYPITINTPNLTLPLPPHTLLLIQKHNNIHRTILNPTKHQTIQNKTSVFCQRSKKRGWKWSTTKDKGQTNNKTVNISKKPLQRILSQSGRRETASNRSLKVDNKRKEKEADPKP